jgi:hypothetical protein
VKHPKGDFPIEPKAEIFPVPVEMLPKVWPYARPWLAKIPGFDLAGCRNRLLLGQDMLWMAAPFSWPVPCGDEKKRLAKKTGCIGVAITSVTEKPPLPWRGDARIPLALRRQSHLRKRFRNKPAEELRTLKVHLAAGAIRLWIDSAVERITAYGKQQKCRILFLMAQKGWRKMAIRFWSRDWDLIAYSRDRVEKKRPNIRGSDPRYLRYWGAQRVGYYRILQPVEKRKKEGCAGYRLRFELKELR